MTDEIDEKVRKDVGRIADAAEKLLNEVARLRRDVVNLYGRIEPFKDEQLRCYEKTPTKITNLSAAIDAISEARTGVVLSN